MHRRKLVAGAAAGAVTLAVPGITKGAVMVKEVRQYVVKGMFALVPSTLGAVGTTSDTEIELDGPSVMVRLGGAESPFWGPGNNADELAIIVPEDQASRWQFGKTFTMTITED